MVRQVQRVRPHQVRKGQSKRHHMTYPGRGKSSGGRWAGAQNLPSRPFLLLLFFPQQWGRVTIHKTGVQPNTIKAKDTPFLYQEGLYSKVSPLPRAKVTGNRGNRRLPALKCRLWSHPTHCPCKFGPVFLLWTICNRLLTLPLQSLFHMATRNFSITQIWAFPSLA